MLRSLSQPLRLATEAAHHTYDGYLSPLADLIRSGANEEAVIDFLKEREAETMCFPALGRRHLTRVAKKLIALRGDVVA